MSGGVHLVGGGETKMDDPLHAFILLLQHIHYSTFLAGEFLHCIYSWMKQVSLCAHQWWATIMMMMMVMVATIIISKQEGLQKVEWKASVWATLCGGGGRFL